VSKPVDMSDGQRESPPGSVEWWRLRYVQGQRRRPRDDGLSIDRLTAAALAIVDAEGLDALTMRRLAADLGAGVASLYRHVANREELLVEMMDHVLGEICPPPLTKTWREDAEWLAREFRRVLLAHPGLLPVLSTDRLLGPNAMRGREMSLRGLLDHGFPPPAAVSIYSLLVAWVLGYTMLTGRIEAHERRGDSDRAAVYQRLDAGQYPTVQGLAHVGGAVGDDVIFDLGLATILDGIEARAAD